MGVTQKKLQQRWSEQKKSAFLWAHLDGYTKAVNYSYFICFFVLYQTRLNYEYFYDKKNQSKQIKSLIYLNKQ